MRYGYARVSTDGQSVDAQVRQLTKAGCEKVFREVASGAKTDRAQLRRLLDRLAADDVLLVTRLDRLARSTRDLLNILAAITGKKAGFRSLGDTWADTTTPHGRLVIHQPPSLRRSRRLAAPVLRLAAAPQCQLPPPHRRQRRHLRSDVGAAARPVGGGRTAQGEARPPLGDRRPGGPPRGYTVPPKS